MMTNYYVGTDGKMHCREVVYDGDGSLRHAYDYVMAEKRPELRTEKKGEVNMKKHDDSVDSLTYVKMLEKLFEAGPNYGYATVYTKPQNVPSITNVIFSGPATIIKWEDGTKTIVKAENEDFDHEKGLAMAIAKKALGNKGNYYNTFKKWLPKEETYENEDEVECCANCAFTNLPGEDEPCSNCDNYSCFKLRKKEAPVVGKPKTLRDWMKEHHPEEISDIFLGGVLSCPGELGIDPDVYCLCRNEEAVPEEGEDNQCRRCWDQPLPEGFGKGK